MQIPISIFIICKNEEDIIERCLQQAQKLKELCDGEIIVVDSGSIDSTLEIAQNYADVLEHHDWEGYAKQKNYALSLCSNDWALNLDADEILTDALINEIASLLLDKQDDIVAYKIARRLYLAQTFIRYGGYYPDYQLRLFRREFASYAITPVHESIELVCPISGTVIKQKGESRFVHKLREPLNHYAYDSFTEMKETYMSYASLANQGIEPHRKSLTKACQKSAFTFFYKFFVRMGFLHGALGLKIALMHTKYSFIKWR